MAPRGDDRNLQDGTKSEKIGGVERPRPGAGAEACQPVRAERLGVAGTAADLLCSARDSDVWKCRRLAPKPINHQGHEGTRSWKPCFSFVLLCVLRGS